MSTARKIFSWIVICVFFLVTGFACVVWAQGNYPNKPIRVVLGVSPGGAMETAARLWQPFLEDELGVPVVIDCIPGGGGIVANRVVLQEPADGYTFSMMPLVYVPSQVKIFGAPYKMDAFEVISNYITDPYIVAVNKKSNWQTAEELFEFIKNSPPKLVTFSVTTLTTHDYFTLRLIEEQLDIVDRLNIVPFGGGNPQRLALAGGHVDATVTGLFSSMHIDEFRRVLAVVQNENHWPELTDNAPTANESLEISLDPLADQITLFAPAGFSSQYPERYKIFLDAFRRALNNPKFKEKLEETGQAGRFIWREPEESQELLDSVIKAYEEKIYLLGDIEQYLEK